ncbi:hypothetical protein B5181_31710, partial [Streptomyces sp. 4F]
LQVHRGGREPDPAHPERLDALLALLEGPDRPLEEVCDLLLRTLHEPENSDDVALLIARATPPDAPRPGQAP